MPSLTTSCTMPSGWRARGRPLGHVLAALASYRGALAMLEMLREEGVDLGLGFKGTNLMHIACMNAQLPYREMAGDDGPWSWRLRSLTGADGRSTTRESGDAVARLLA